MKARHLLLFALFLGVPVGVHALDWDESGARGAAGGGGVSSWNDLDDIPPDVENRVAASAAGSPFVVTGTGNVLELYDPNTDISTRIWMTLFYADNFGGTKTHYGGLTLHDSATGRVGIYAGGNTSTPIMTWDNSTIVANKAIFLPSGIYIYWDNLTGSGSFAWRADPDSTTDVQMNWPVDAGSQNQALVRDATDGTTWANVCLEDGTNCPEAEAGGSGSSSLAVTTGTALGFTTTTSSPTAVVVFDQEVFRVTLTESTTAFIELLTGAIKNEHVGDGELDLNKFAQDGDGFTNFPDDEYVAVVGSTITGHVKGRQFISSFTYEVAGAQPAFVHDATLNAFDVRATTNPTYGLVQFDPATDEATNCAYFKMPVPRDHKDYDLRLEEFSVFKATSTDAGTQEYNLAVSTVAQGINPRTSTYSHPITVQFSATSRAADTLEFITTPQTLTDWDTKVTAGVPTYVRVCRDGNDGTNDTSIHTSRLERLMIRGYHTLP
jgi:hypothetical protein